jgi:general secretion pathway protein L
VARELDEENMGQPVLMWSRSDSASRDEMQKASWQIGASIITCLVLSLGLSLWAIVSASSIGAENERLVARSQVLQRQLQGTSTAAASLNPGERAWLAKETSPSVVVTLEALSRALPDSAYVSELQLEKGTLRIVGLANDAPSLIEPLQGSGYLSEVRFFAPTTRGSDNIRFKFYLEAKVNPQPKFVEPQPW